MLWCRFNRRRWADRRLALGFAVSTIATCTMWASACSWFYHCDPQEPIRYPAQATNLSALNSEWDDWNCAVPWEQYRSGDSILFSSNRATKGGTFDLVSKELWISAEHGFSVEAREGGAPWAVARLINTDADELGPTALLSDAIHAWPMDGLTFSRGVSDDHDLWAAIASADDYADLVDLRAIDVDAGAVDLAPGAVLHPLTPLNSTADDGYLTWLGSEGPLFFHSNRGGAYRIWQATLPTGTSLADWLRNPTELATVEPVAELASDGEERCPFIFRGNLSFVSTRSGGHGGWDVYTSRYVNGAWSSPVNAGSAINSSSDEYRPVLTEDFLLFSSNRPGGLGGFDLYLAGMNLPTELDADSPK